MRDLVALCASYLFVILCLSAAEVAGRRFGVSSYTTRKLIHVAVGTWIVPTLLLFEDWQWAVLPPATFLVVNGLALRKGALRSMQGADPRNYGPVFFPLAFIVLIPLFWQEHLKSCAAVGILCMAWGDPLASAAGRALGRRTYRVMGSVRSLEGSAFMFVGCLAAAVVGALVFSEWSGGRLAVMAVSVAAAGTAVEAISCLGSDDLTVPLAASAVSWLFALGGP